MKKTITIPVGKILGAVTLGEGMCASVLVDKALQAVPMNPIVKTIGRGAVSALVSMPFSVSAIACWATDIFDIKIGGQKDSRGKRIEDDDLEDLVKNLEDHDEIYIGTFYKGDENLCIEHLCYAAQRGIVDETKGAELAEKVCNARKAALKHEQMTQSMQNHKSDEINADNSAPAEKESKDSANMEIPLTAATAGGMA